MESPILQMQNISKSFPGVRALDGVSLTIHPGSVHALMGENGAGKSTLMKCLFGIYSPDSGTIILNGRKVRFHSPHEALKSGVAMVHQELNQALSRSVMDNMWLGRYPGRLGIVDRREMLTRTGEIFDRLGITADPSARLSSLSVSQRQMVEIAKAVSYDARVIVFDEPTSSLSHSESEQLFRIIDQLRDSGCGIIYISHKMEEILRISDEVTIMRDGRRIDTRPAGQLTMEEMIRLMVGRELTSRFPPKPSPAGDVFLRVEGLSGRYSRLRGASFSLRRGEILGVAGLDGSGRTELLETIFGLRSRLSGKVTLDGRPAAVRNPREAIKKGFALITEERRSTGIFGIRDVRENTVIANLRGCLTAGLVLSEAKMRRDTDWAIETLGIRTPGQHTQMRALSGGNQQKVILGRWLLTKPRVLLLDEPTRGIDVGAKFEIYRLIAELAREGLGVIMVSSEMPELLGVCHRIMVMSGGRVAGEVDAASTSQEEILTLAAKYI